MSELFLGDVAGYREKMAERMVEADQQRLNADRQNAEKESLHDAWDAVEQLKGFTAMAENTWLIDRGDVPAEGELSLEDLQAYHEQIEATRPSDKRDPELKNLRKPVPGEAEPEITFAHEPKPIKLVVTNTTIINAIADRVATNPFLKAEYLAAETETPDYSKMTTRQLKSYIETARADQLELVSADAAAALEARREAANQARQEARERKAAEEQAAREALEQAIAEQLAADEAAEAAEVAAQTLDRSKVGAGPLAILDALNGGTVAQPQPPINTGTKLPKAKPENTPKPNLTPPPVLNNGSANETPKNFERAPKINAVIAHYSEIAKGGDNMDRITANKQLGLYTMIEDLNEPNAEAAEATDALFDAFWSRHAASLSTETAFGLMKMSIVEAQAMLAEEFGAPENSGLPMTILKFFEDEAGKLNAVMGNLGKFQTLYVSEVAPDGTIAPIVNLTDQTPIKVLYDIGRDTRFALVSDAVTSTEHPISEEDIKQALGIAGEADLVAQQLFKLSTGEDDDKSVIVIDVEGTVAQPRDDAAHEAGKAARPAQAKAPSRRQARRAARRERKNRKPAEQAPKDTTQATPQKEKKDPTQNSQSLGSRIGTRAVRHNLIPVFGTKAKAAEIQRLIEEEAASVRVKEALSPTPQRQIPTGEEIRADLEARLAANRANRQNGNSQHATSTVSPVVPTAGDTGHPDLDHFFENDEGEGDTPVKTVRRGRRPARRH